MNDPKKKKNTGNKKSDKPFSSCRRQVLAALKKHNLNLKRDIITSRDRAAIDARNIVSSEGGVKQVEGFSRLRLPFFLEGEGVNFYMSTAVAHTIVEKHAHNHGPVVRFILEGSIMFNRKEYVTGDWIYIPKNIEYSFKVGERGASFILGYQCCC